MISAFVSSELNLFLKMMHMTGKKQAIAKYFMCKGKGTWVTRRIGTCSLTLMKSLGEEVQGSFLISSKTLSVVLDMEIIVQTKSVVLHVEGNEDSSV